MRHLLAVWRLRQLLGDDAGQCAENSFSLLDGEGHPEPLRNRVDGLPSCGAGGDNGGSRLAHDNPPC